MRERPTPPRRHLAGACTAVHLAHAPPLHLARTSASSGQVMREMKPSLAEEMDAATKLQTGTKSDLVVP